MYHQKWTTTHFSIEYPRPLHPSSPSSLRLRSSRGVPEIPSSYAQAQLQGAARSASGMCGWWYWCHLQVRCEGWRWRWRWSISWRRCRNWESMRRCNWEEIDGIWGTRNRFFRGERKSENSFAGWSPFGLKTWKISFISFQLKMENPPFFNQKVCENDPKMYMFGWSMYIHIFVVENHLMLNGKGWGICSFLPTRFGISRLGAARGWSAAWTAPSGGGFTMAMLKLPVPVFFSKGILSQV